MYYVLCTMYFGGRNYGTLIKNLIDIKFFDKLSSKKIFVWYVKFPFINFPVLFSWNLVTLKPNCILVCWLYLSYRYLTILDIVRRKTELRPNLLFNDFNFRLIPFAQVPYWSCETNQFILHNATCIILVYGCKDCISDKSQH